MTAMKKILLPVVIALLVIAGSAIWIWRATGITDAAVFLPADTVALVSLPDVPRTLMRWPKTTLAQIGAEPEMQAFLEKPFQYFSKDRGGDEASGILLNLKPGRIFAAALSVSGPDAALLIGFQYWGGKLAHDAAVARLRQEIAGNDALLEPTREDYLGTEITSTTQMGVTISNASHGKWGFLSNDLAALKATLDRANGRTQENALVDSPPYLSVMTHLAADPDLIVYVQPKNVLDSLLAVGKSLGAEAIPQQMDQARKVEAVGATIKLDGADLHDTLFVLRPDPPDVGSLTHKATRFAAENSIAYFDFVANIEQISNLATNPILATLAQLPGLQNSRLPALLPQAFGPECAVTVSWDDKPDGLMAVEIRDAAKAEESLQEVLSLFPETEVREINGARAYSFPSLQSAFANPTFTLTDEFLLIGLNDKTLAAARQAAQTGTSLESAPVFAAALPSYHSANEVFGYVNTRNLFEHGYPILRPVLIFSAQVMPGISNVIDSSKLPNTATIAEHLTPMVYSQTRLPEGYLVDSRGPISMTQALIIGALASGPFQNLVPGAGE
jgi:hypothetical protein